jgi:radical SAM protein with 4Fe4S-binding SPASM domain
MESTKKTRYVMLTLTHDCNLRCRYCYEPNKSRDHYMSIETAKQAVAEYMEADDGFEGVQFDFFGGEPMLAFDVIHELVDWFHSQPERWRKGHQFYIGTNGTILPEEAKPWLLKYKQCVLGGVSLDGNRIAHNLNRSNSYDQVMENLPFYRELWPTQPYKMTISAETIPHVADSIIDLEEKGIPFTANLVFEDIWGAPEQKTQLLGVYAEQLDRLVDYYTARPDLFPAFMLSRKLEYVSRPTDLEAPSRDCVRFCGAGHETVMVDIDGTRHPCHRFAPWVTGKPAPSGPVNRHAEWHPQQCAECDLVGLCPTCAGLNWNENGDASIRTTHHCEAFKLELLATAKLLANRLSQKQPKDVANLPVEEASTIKRQLDTILKFASVGI